MMMKNLFLAFITLSAASLSYAGETDLVPKGRSLFYFRYTQAEIEGKFSPSGAPADYNVSGRLDEKVVKKFAPEAHSLYKELAAIDPKLAEELDFGQVNISPELDMNVRVFAGAHSFTRNFMLVGALPYYEAKVTLEGGYSDTQSVEITKEALQRYVDKNPQSAAMMSQILSQLPEVSGGALQSALVSEMGYKPLGNWSGSGVGDFTLYGHYRFQKLAYSAQAMRFGTTAPTGRPDDPDDLVDVPFGTGYWAPFAEYIYDFQFDSPSTLSLMAKYEHPLKTEKKYRLYEDPDVPLSDKSENLEYQPGSTYTLTAKYKKLFFEKYRFVGAFSWYQRDADEIESSSTNYDTSILEERTRQSGQILQVGGDFTTVELFKHRKFAVPFVVGVNAARVMAGSNIPKYTAYTLDLTLLF